MEGRSNDVGLVEDDVQGNLTDGAGNFLMIVALLEKLVRTWMTLESLSVMSQPDCAATCKQRRVDWDDGGLYMVNNERWLGRTCQCGFSRVRIARDCGPLVKYSTNEGTVEPLTGY